MDVETEKLNDKPVPGKNGGARLGSGRKQGSKNKATIEKQIAEEAFRQRILINLDKLFNAQLALAKGEAYMYRIDEVKDSKGKVKREHNIVTDKDEIKDVLDETDGNGGSVDDNYYYISIKKPEQRSIDSMVDRAFGKAPQSVDLTSKGDKINMMIYLPEKEKE